MATHPSFADVPPSTTPINKEWADAAGRERFWFGLQSLALGLLFLAVLSWPRTPPNIAIEAGLVLFVAFAAMRTGRSSRARARLQPVPATAPLPVTKTPSKRAPSVPLA